jgi:hydrogenase maturation protease
MGNVLLGDDGFGPYVVRHLEAAWELPEGVEVHDLGTPGSDLIPYLSDARAVIVIDTVSSDAPPGELRLYRRSELPAAPLAPRTSPHEPGLFEALATAELVDQAPESVLLVGVVPAEVTTGTGLSPAVRAAVDDGILTIAQELERLETPIVRRAEPLEPDIWWE